jgi:hypothetical protein
MTKQGFVYAVPPERPPRTRRPISAPADDTVFPAELSLPTVRGTAETNPLTHAGARPIAARF